MINVNYGSAELTVRGRQMVKGCHYVTAMSPGIHGPVVCIEDGNNARGGAWVALASGDTGTAGIDSNWREIDGEFTFRYK